LRIIEATLSIPTKCFSVIKATKCPWVVQTRASQIQDGGWPPSRKIEKSPYFSNDLTDRTKFGMV